MIRKIIKEDNYEHRHITDVKRLQRVMLQNGYESDLRSVAGLWDDYSDTYAAGWIGLPENDEELWGILRNKINE